MVRSLPVKSGKRYFSTREVSTPASCRTSNTARNATGQLARPPDTVEYTQPRSLPHTFSFIATHSPVRRHTQLRSSPHTTLFIATHSPVHRHTQPRSSPHTTRFIATHSPVHRHTQLCSSPHTAPFIATHNPVHRHTQKLTAKFELKSAGLCKTNSSIPEWLLLSLNYLFI